MINFEKIIFHRETRYLLLITFLFNKCLILCKYQCSKIVSDIIFLLYVRTTFLFKETIDYVSPLEPR